MASMKISESPPTATFPKRLGALMPIGLLAIGLLILLAIALAVDSNDSQRRDPMVRLPRIVGDTWFNTRPPTPADLEGKVVLVDFWTYTCVNCQRTLPYLRQWWERYKDKGLVIIGIHTPEFEFEKDPKNVAQALGDLDVGWPVVLDNDRANWTNFANRYWPAKYLADKNGRLVYWHFGEGEYAETERVIQELLADGMAGTTLPEVVEDEHQHAAVCFVPTPETYCGYGRGSLANPSGYQYDRVANYRAPEALRRDSIALAGPFGAAPEFVESAATGATLLLSFHATEVNLVLHPAGESATVAITLNGKPLPADIRGRDVTDAGEVRVTKPTMYNLLRSHRLVEGVLSIAAREGQFQAYAFTFAGCEE